MGSSFNDFLVRFFPPFPEIEGTKYPSPAKPQAYFNSWNWTQVIPGVRFRIVQHRQSPAFFQGLVFTTSFINHWGLLSHMNFMLIPSIWSLFTWMFCLCFFPFISRPNYEMWELTNYHTKTLLSSTYFTNLVSRHSYRGEQFLFVTEACTKPTSCKHMVELFINSSTTLYFIKHKSNA